MKYAQIFALGTILALAATAANAQYVDRLGNYLTAAQPLRGGRRSADFLAIVEPHPR